VSAEPRRQSETLERTMLDLRDARDPDDVLGIASRALARDFRRPCSAYHLRDGIFRPVAASDPTRTRDPIAASDIDMDALRSRGLVRHGAADVVGIASDGNVRAILVLEESYAALDDGDTKYLRAIAAHVSLALTNAHAFEQLRRYAAEGAALTEAAKTILGYTELEPLADALSKLCARMLPAEFVAVYARRGDALVRIGAVRPLSQGFVAPLTLPADDESAARAELAAALPPATFLVAAQLNAAVAGSTGSRGLLVCCRRQPFERPQQRLIETFVALASLAIRNVDLYEQSTQANQALAESNAFKDDLMAMFAHDFKGPLTAISGFSELLFDSEDADVRRSAETISAQTKRLARLSEDALALAATQSAGFSLQRRSEDLTAFLRATIAQLDPEKRVSVVAPPEPAIASFDRVRLRHVIDNVVGNALKYSTGPITARVEPGSTEVAVAVSDTGIGIPEGDLATVFARFGRGGNARSSGIAGSGVGLYIAKKIVDVHGGRIEVESRLDRGSTFRIVLPAPAS
jgi:signal transduction histidine kinase